MEKKFDMEQAEMLERKRLQDQGVLPAPFDGLHASLQSNKKKKAAKMAKKKKK